MKAKPFKLVEGNYQPCLVEEATHIKFKMPGPIGTLILPVILRGTREGTNCWSWNGSTDAPTLKPSVLSHCGDVRCHSHVNDGKAHFLPDCSHALANQTVDLLDVEED